MGHTNKNRIDLLVKFQSKIGYKFNDVKLLNRALTHSSYANEQRRERVGYNERLEFLGDSVLGLVVSNYIFDKYPNYPEGELTKLRATVVCEGALSLSAKKIDLGKYLLLGKGEEATGGRDRDSILADAFEAVIGSIYIDGNLVKASNFVLENLTDIIDEAVKGNLFIDYKTELQETLQKTTKDKIKYEVLKEVGPDHNKTFHIGLMVGENLIGKGTGKSKKEAEQNSAKKALINLGVLDG